MESQPDDNPQRRNDDSHNEPDNQAHFEETREIQPDELTASGDMQHLSDAALRFNPMDEVRELTQREIADGIALASDLVDPNHPTAQRHTAQPRSLREIIQRLHWILTRQGAPRVNTPANVRLAIEDARTDANPKIAECARILIEFPDETITEAYGFIVSTLGENFQKPRR